MKNTKLTIKEKNLRPLQITNPKDVRLTFTQLTHRTCPHGHEDALYGQMLDEHGFTRDEHGNYWAVRGEPTHGIVFAAHLDTVGSRIKRVNHVWYGRKRRFVKTDGKTVLGADDKAGVSILLFMLAHDVPGTYALFAGEEVGCVGSKAHAATVTGDGIKGIVSFDRMGYADVITHQGGQRTCSEAFAQKLSDEINKSYPDAFQYKPCSHGMFTDSKSYMRVVPECTNISVGYSNQHGLNEVQDVLWLEALAFAVCRVDWNALPIERDPTTAHSYSYGGYRYRSNWWDEEDGYHSSTSAKDANVDRALFGAGSMSSYFESKYGLALIELSLSDIVEMADYLTNKELTEWVEANPRMAGYFIAEMAAQCRREALEACSEIEYVDSIVTGA